MSKCRNVVLRNVVVQQAGSTSVGDGVRGLSLRDSDTRSTVVVQLYRAVGCVRVH